MWIPSPTMYCRSSKEKGSWDCKEARNWRNLSNDGLTVRDNEMYVGDGIGISQIPFNGSIVSGEIAIIFLFSVFGYQTIGSWGDISKEAIRGKWSEARQSDRISYFARSISKAEVKFFEKKVKSRLLPPLYPFVVYSSEKSLTSEKANPLLSSKFE